jgi:hypothetical protein
MYNRATGAAQITLPIGGGVTLADGATCTTQGADDGSTKVATCAYVDTAAAAAGGGSSVRIFDSVDTTSANYVGNSAASTFTQIDLGETDVLAYYEDTTNSHTPQMALQLPQLSTVAVGDVYRFTNGHYNRYLKVRPYNAESDVYKGIRPASWGSSSTASDLTADYSSKRGLRFICIELGVGKRWFGSNIRTY